MGRADEQSQGTGGGSHSGGISLILTRAKSEIILEPVIPLYYNID